MPVWIPAVFGLLVIFFGAARLYLAKGARDTTLPWQRRRHHESDFEGRNEPWDEARYGTTAGVVLVAVGVLIIVVFALLPALR